MRILLWCLAAASCSRIAEPVAEQADATAPARGLSASSERAPRFVYLVQSADGAPDPTRRLVPTADRDVFYLAWRDPPPPARADVLWGASLTWTEGRNALLELALNRSLERPGAGPGYEYFSMVDDDFLEMVVGDDPWATWEANLLDEAPAIGYVAGAVQWQRKPTQRATARGERCVRSKFNVDAICQARRAR